LDATLKIDGLLSLGECELRLHDQLRLILKHLVRQLETLYALELLVLGFAFHLGRVSEDALEHVLLRQLEAVLVRYLASYDAAGRLLFSPE